jgi:hypothetical protein
VRTTGQPTVEQEQRAANQLDCRQPTQQSEDIERGPRWQQAKVAGHHIFAPGGEIKNKKPRAVHQPKYWLTISLGTTRVSNQGIDPPLQGAKGTWPVIKLISDYVRQVMISDFIRKFKVSVSICHLNLVGH